VRDAASPTNRCVVDYRVRTDGCWQDNAAFTAGAAVDRRGACSNGERPCASAGRGGGSRRPESGQFNWKDYYKRALVALNEPLLAHKIGVNAAENPDAVRPVIRRSASAAALRWCSSSACASGTSRCA
jgi:hypothetical protein